MASWPSVTETKRQVRTAVNALEAVGKTVARVDFFPDGHFQVLLGEPIPAVPVAEQDWTDLAGETEIPRARRA